MALPLRTLKTRRLEPSLMVAPLRSVRSACSVWLRKTVRSALSRGRSVTTSLTYAPWIQLMRTGPGYSLRMVRPTFMKLHTHSWKAALVRVWSTAACGSPSRWPGVWRMIVGQLGIDTP